MKHDVTEIFVAWFLWRCNRYEIKSRWTRRVAEHIMDRLGFDLDGMAKEYDFENLWTEFKPRGLFPND